MKILFENFAKFTRKHLHYHERTLSLCFPFNFSKRYIFQKMCSRRRRPEWYLKLEKDHITQVGIYPRTYTNVRFWSKMFYFMKNDHEIGKEYNQKYKNYVCALFTTMLVKNGYYGEYLNF